MTDSATLQAQLSEAETALHNLTIGNSVVEVEYEGHRVKYARAQIGDLRRHVNSLKRQLGKPVFLGSRRVTF